MAVSPINPAFNLNRSITEAREVLDDLQRQLASGKKSTTYGGLGAERTQVLSFRSEISQLEGYQRTATITNTRLQVANQSLEQMRELVADTRSNALSPNFDLQSGGQTLFQTESKARFIELSALLNSKVGDNYIFGGRETQTAPLAIAEDILYGSGAKAGFAQIMDERLQADQGANLQGRLDLSSSATGQVLPASVDAEVITLTDTAGNVANVTLATGEAASDVAANINTAISQAGLIGISASATGGQLDFAGTATLGGSATGLTALGLPTGIITDNPPSTDNRTGSGGFTDGSGGVDASVNGQTFTLTDINGAFSTFTLTTGESSTDIATAINAAGLQGISVDGSSGQLVFNGTEDAILSGAATAVTEIGFAGISTISATAPVDDTRTGSGGFNDGSGGIDVSANGETITLTDAAGTSATITLATGESSTDIATAINTAGLSGITVDGSSGQLVFTGTGEATLEGSSTALTEIGFAGINIISDSATTDIGSDVGSGGFTQLNATDTVTLTEDGIHSFGFKISTVQSNLTGTSVTATAGPPASQDVAFSNSLPLDGEQITFTLTVPGGEEVNVTLTARTDTAEEPGEFLIGADETATAANFQTALSEALQASAGGDLRAASAFAAADNFFDLTDTQTPQRIDGPPFDSATALIDATESNTVFFYQGEISSTSARASAIAKVDDSIVVQTGARANEEAFRDVLKNFAILSVAEFDQNDENAEAAYDKIAFNVSRNFLNTSGNQTVSDIVTELAVAAEAVDSSNERHKTSEALLQGFLDEAENSNTYEVSAQILNLQTRLQASLSVTAALRQTSLVNFL